MIAAKVMPYKKKAFPAVRQPRYSGPLRKKKMTIAAGFCCSDGVVLCADTQYTVPASMKYPESKLRMGTGLKSLPFFAFCGDMDYQKQCIENFTAAIANAERDGPIRIITLEASALEMHQHYYEQYADPNEKLSASMLISLWIGSKRVLYRINGPRVARVDQIECLGDGNSLARALADSFWEPSNSMYRTALACVFILSDVKKYVDGCGGDSQIVCLGHDGSWKFFSEDDFTRTPEIAEIEEHYQKWKKRLGAMLLDSQDFRDIPIPFEDNSNNLCRDLVATRAKQASFFDQIDEWKLQALARELKEKQEGKD